MKRHFEASLAHQRAAIEAIRDLFRGQEVCRTEFTVVQRAPSPQMGLAMEPGMDASALGVVGNRRALQLARMRLPALPCALGIFRQMQAPVYGLDPMPDGLLDARPQPGTRKGAWVRKGHQRRKGTAHANRQRDSAEDAQNTRCGVSHHGK